MALNWAVGGPSSAPLPLPLLGFFTLQCVRLSLNAYSRKRSRGSRHRDRKNVVKDHIQEGSPKVDEHSSNDPLDETGSNRCFNLDLWRAAIRQWSERKSELSQILAKLRWERSKIAANLKSQRIAPKSRKNHLSLRKIIDPPI